MIREVVSGFVRNEKYPLNTSSSYLPRASRGSYRAVAAYLPRSDWGLLARISKETRRCKNHLIREAVDEYLKKSPQIEE